MTLIVGAVPVSSMNRIRQISSDARAVSTASPYSLMLRLPDFPASRRAVRYTTGGLAHFAIAARPVRL
jgi:hypothetical protein